jgi:hypothetical protein
MPKKTNRSERLAIRVAGLLREELEHLAERNARGTSDYVRRVLIDHVIEHTAASAEREAA